MYRTRPTSLQQVQISKSVEKKLCFDNKKKYQICAQQSGVNKTEVWLQYYYD